MLKRYSLYLIILILWAGIGLADSWISLQKQFETTKRMNYLNQVWIYIVDEITQATPKDYLKNINQWESKPITLLLKNESEKNLNVRVKFTDQAVSNGGTKWCSAEYTQWFAKFIKAPRTGDIRLPAQSEIRKKIELKFPVWIKGIQKWCIAYGVTEDIQEGKQEMLSIITRKIIYIDTLIWWAAEINYNIFIGNSIKSINKQWELIIKLPIKNSGNIDSKVNIEWNISNILGFERLIMVSGMIHKWEEWTLISQAIKLPFYQWLFTIRLNIKDSPDFGFDASKLGIDKKIITWWEKEIIIRYFKWHRWMIIGILLITIITYLKLRKKKTEW